MSESSALPHSVILVFVVLVAIFVLILIAILIFVVLIILLSITVEVHHGVLLILIFGDQIAHIFIRLLELHLVHALAFVPMQERLALVHLRKLRRNALKHALNRRRIRHERAPM